MAAFLAEIGDSGVVLAGCRRAGMSSATAYRWKRQHSGFSEAWDAALDAAEAGLQPLPLVDVEEDDAHRGRINPNWPKQFLRILAETSNVTAAAQQAEVDTSRVYRMRRENPQFAADWRTALAEGYDHLEMEMLAVLRGRDTATRKLDVSNAVRLLAAHRKTMAEVRAAQEPDDEQAVLASIDALFDSFRREAAAVDASAEKTTRDEEGEAGNGEHD